MYVLGKLGSNHGAPNRHAVYVGLDEERDIKQLTIYSAMINKYDLI